MRSSVFRRRRDACWVLRGSTCMLLYFLGWGINVVEPVGAVLGLCRGRTVGSGFLALLSGSILVHLLGGELWLVSYG